MQLTRSVETPRKTWFIAVAVAMLVGAAGARVANIGVRHAHVRWAATCQSHGVQHRIDRLDAWTHARAR